MSKDLNKCTIIGRLGKDPEMRFTPGGSAVTTFSVAVGRQWRNGDGQQQEETEWFTVVAWAKLGEICNEHLRKGSRIYIEGRIQTRTYDDKDGVKRYKTELIASDMIILDSRKADQPDAASQDADGIDWSPPARTPNKPGPHAQHVPGRSQPDDDIPF